jgi:hypothetical protein
LDRSLTHCVCRCKRHRQPSSAYLCGEVHLRLGRDRRTPQTPFFCAGWLRTRTACSRDGIAHTEEDAGYRHLCGRASVSAVESLLGEHESLPALTSKVTLHFALPTGVAGLIPATMLCRRRLRSLRGESDVPIPGLWILGIRRRRERCMSCCHCGLSWLSLCRLEREARRSLR